MLLDTHYHLDFITDPDIRAQLLRHIRTAGVEVVPQTLTPASYKKQQRTHPLLSLGFHPWQVTTPEENDRQLQIFADALPTTRLIGEIGLDFSPRRLDSANQNTQEYVLRRIFELVGNAANTQADHCATQNPKPYVMSLHAVRSVDRVLDLLEETRLHRQVNQGIITPVVHWFSGTSDQLTRLMRMGGYISINPRMLDSKRGRAYAKQVPTQRLLLETDLPTEEIPPPGLDSASVMESGAGVMESGAGVGHECGQCLIDTLEHTVTQLNELRGGDIREALERNQRRLYG